jgi:hypothetical protein
MYLVKGVVEATIIDEDYDLVSYRGKSNRFNRAGFGSLNNTLENSIKETNNNNNEA